MKTQACLENWSICKYFPLRVSFYCSIGMFYQKLLLFLRFWACQGAAHGDSLFHQLRAKKGWHATCLILLPPIPAFFVTSELMQFHQLTAKKGWLATCLILLPLIPSFFVASELMRTAVHKEAAFTIMFLWLLNTDFLTNGQETNWKTGISFFSFHCYQ